MNRASSPPGIPEHLRRFIVEQDYSEYDAVDQAVWRFVLLQLSSRLGERAHPAYERGLSATGISVERIPSIAEMNEKLSRFGWGAVCVDGFIPPRAFQEFQAHGILPIAAEIRTREHLVYTPAPDIIHEAAGHAPILPEVTYGAYLRRIGEIGAFAFALPSDTAVHDAIHALSEIKEDPGATPEQVAGAEAGLSRALELSTELSEVARLSRLYWWTAEYGLVGSPTDYRVYGAGLLSSLGESHACQSSSVSKLPLDEGCLEVAYDITRPQPQLFVTPDFESLHDLLSRVERTLAVRIGGQTALSLAAQSRELATFTFDSGAQAIGVLGRVLGEVSAPALLELEGPAAFAWQGAILSDHGPERHAAGALVPVGRLRSGARLERLLASDLERYTLPSGRLRFEFEMGAVVEGKSEGRRALADDTSAVFELSDAVVSFGAEPPRRLLHLSLLAAGAFVTAGAGSVDRSFHPKSERSKLRVPRPRAPSIGERGLRRWYVRVAQAREVPNRDAERLYRSAERMLRRDHPREWLLRFVMLEDLTRRGLETELTSALEKRLNELEVEYGYEQPIASGLAYLARRVA